MRFMYQGIIKASFVSEAWSVAKGLERWEVEGGRISKQISTLFGIWTLNLSIDGPAH